MGTIDRRLADLERTHGDKPAPNYIVIRGRIDGPLTDADLELLAAGGVRIKGYVGISPDAWPPA